MPERTGDDVRQSAIEVVVVSSAACHFCEETIEALEELRHEFPLSIRIVHIRSEKGAAVEREHLPPMPPFVLVETERTTHRP